MSGAHVSDVSDVTHQALRGNKGCYNITHILAVDHTRMPESSLEVLEEIKNLVMGDLDLALKVITAPRHLPLLASIRQMLRRDLSTISRSSTLHDYREIADQLDRMLQMNDPLRRARLCELIGPRHEIEAVLEALEEMIEDLEIATSPQVHAAIERLIDEAKTP